MGRATARLFASKGWLLDVTMSTHKNLTHWGKISVAITIGLDISKREGYRGLLGRFTDKTLLFPNG